MRLNAVPPALGFGDPPEAPIMGYVSLGVFEVTNYVAGAVYTPVLITGGGTATWDSGTHRFTLSSLNARFSVTAGWTAYEDQSAPDYMERKAHAYDIYNHVWVCTYETFDNCGPPLHPDGSYYCYCGTLGSCGNPDDCCGWVCHSGYWNDYYTLNPAPGSAGYTNSGSEWYKVS